MSKSVELTDALAQRIIAAAAEAAATGGDTRYAVAVVDTAGNLKAFARQDGAPLNAVQVAQDKAYTAASSGMATQQWSEMLAADPRMAVGAPSGIARFVALGGGIPLAVGGRPIGAVGVSGGHYSDDTRVAEAAVREAHRAADAAASA